jgi:hypothetical protein
MNLIKVVNTGTGFVNTVVNLRYIFQTLNLLIGQVPANYSGQSVRHERRKQDIHSICERFTYMPMTSSRPRLFQYRNNTNMINNYNYIFIMQ